MLNLSRELELGRAAEHLVVADLILGGYPAFLAEAGLPYDVVVDVEGVLRKVQVKATMGPMPTRPHLYRFQTRRAKGARQRFVGDQLDVMACVALDLRLIAYVPVELVRNATGFLATAIEFRTRSRAVPADSRQSFGRFFEDYLQFRLTPNPLKRCNSCLEQFPPTRDYFTPNYNYPDRVTGTCRRCYNQDANERKKRRRRKVPDFLDLLFS